MFHISPPILLPLPLLDLLHAFEENFENTFSINGTKKVLGFINLCLFTIFYWKIFSVQSTNFLGRVLINPNTFFCCVWQHKNATFPKLECWPENWCGISGIIPSTFSYDQFDSQGWVSNQLSLVALSESFDFGSLCSWKWCFKKINQLYKK